MLVIHHTDCGMETFNNEIMGNLLAGSLKTASVDESGWHDCNSAGGTTDSKYIEWFTISDQNEMWEYIDHQQFQSEEEHKIHNIDKNNDELF